MLGCFLSLHQVAGPADVWVNGVATGPEPHLKLRFPSGGSWRGLPPGNTGSNIVLVNRMPIGPAPRVTGAMVGSHCGNSAVEAAHREGRARPVHCPTLRSSRRGSARTSPSKCPQHGRDPPAEAAPSIPPTGQPAGQAGGGWFQVMLLKFFMGAAAPADPAASSDFWRMAGWKEGPERPPLQAERRKLLRRIARPA